MCGSSAARASSLATLALPRWRLKKHRTGGGDRSRPRPGRRPPRGRHGPLGDPLCGARRRGSTELGRRCDDWGDVDDRRAEASAVGDERMRFLRADQGDVRADRRHSSRSAVEDGFVPLVLGGDHSVALGTLGGLARARGPGGVLWLDAHGDLNRPETSPTGNVHGMALAAALGLARAGVRERRVPAARRRAAAGRARRRPLARPRRARRCWPSSRRARVHDERPRPDGRRDRDARGARARQRRRVRARQPRHGRARSRGRARRGHARSRRALLPRGAPGDGAGRRVGPRAARSRWSRSTRSSTARTRPQSWPSSWSQALSAREFCNTRETCSPGVPRVFPPAISLAAGDSRV